MVTVAFHKDITPEKWAARPASWQVLSIASEMGRAEASLKNRLPKPFKASLERTLELIDLTVEANLARGEFVREMLRFREVLAEVYVDSTHSMNASKFRFLTKILLTLDPGAYNLLGPAY
jgi:hypothetical protein